MTASTSNSASPDSTQDGLPVAESTVEGPAEGGIRTFGGTLFAIPGARSSTVALGAGASVVLLFLLAGGMPGVLESVFVRGWAVHVIPPLSRLSGLLPLAVVELMLAGYLGFRLYRMFRGTRAVLRGANNVSSAAGSAVFVALRDVGVALVVFYGLWGFHYARTPATERLGLPTLEEVEDEELVQLSRELIHLSNDAYVALHGTRDATAPTRMPDRWADLHGALEEGWRRSASILPLGPMMTASFGPAKPLMLSRVIAYLGITGIYSPFTAEALVVANTPAVSLGLSLAHEQAHQRGITDEGEATFLGFVAAMESGDPLLRYSAATRAQNRFLSLLMSRDATAAEELLSLRHPGVTRDLNDLRRFQRLHRGRPARAAARVNDAYLRANRVAGGVRSYDAVTGLLVRYARSRGGTFEIGRMREARLDSGSAETGEPETQTSDLRFGAAAP